MRIHSVIAEIKLGTDSKTKPPNSAFTICNKRIIIIVCALINENKLYSGKGYEINFL